MKRFFSFCLLCFFVFSLMTSFGVCQEAAEILGKIIEAQGGRKLLESIKDTKFLGTLDMIQMGMSGSMTMYHKEPNKMRQDIEIMGMIITIGCDGEIAWMVNPQTGSAEEMPEKMAEDIKRQALSFGNDSFLNPEKHGITFGYKGKETIEGRDYFVLEQTFSDGHKATNYVDAQTYLLYKINTTSLNQMGVEVETETFMSDYKKIDGIMFPQSILVFQDDEEYMKMSVIEVNYNTGLEDSLFKMSD